MGTISEQYQKQLLTTTADQITEETEEQYAESPSDKKRASVTVGSCTSVPYSSSSQEATSPRFTDCTAQLPRDFFLFLLDVFISNLSAILSFK